MPEYIIIVTNPTTEPKYQVIEKHKKRGDGISSGMIYLEGELQDTFESYEDAVLYIREIE